MPSATGNGRDSAFGRFARRTAVVAGHGLTFTVALVALLVWFALGPAFGWSDSWQLLINTGTTVVTFLMVFLIQSTQNRDTGAIQIKLDELIRAVRGARNEMIDLEALDPASLAEIRSKYERLAEKARTAALPDTGSPDLPADAT